jgi:hypothetical protein
VSVSEVLWLDGPGRPGEAGGRSAGWVGVQDPEGDQGAMDPGVWGPGPAAAADRSGGGAVVVVVGGGVAGRVVGTAPADGAVLVVVLGAWPVGVLPPAGPRPTGLPGGPGVAGGQPAGRPGPGSTGRRAVEDAEDGEASAVGAGAGGSAVAGYLFRREGEYWTVVFEGVVVRLRDAKGLGHLARLLADPGREFHVLELAGATRQPGPSGRGGVGELRVRPDLGDAGVLLDATAKAAYRARLVELGAELEAAEAGNDPARAARARQESEFLVAELARAVGLGGRDRRAAAHAERARLNVTRAIRAAMANLARANPALGRHLAVTIRTGRYCAYTPDPRTPIAWQR